MSLEPVRRLLLEQGWQKYHNNLFKEPREYWAKRYKDARRCECNHDRDGISVIVWIHEYEVHGNPWKSVEVEVTGEYQAQWYKLQAYSMSPDDFLAKHGAIIARLLRAWEGLSA